MESIKQDEATKERSLKIAANPQAAHAYKREKHVRVKINYQLQYIHILI